MKKKYLIIGLILMLLGAAGTIRAQNSSALMGTSALDTLRQQYHAEMNALFNTSTSLMVEGKGIKNTPENEEDCGDDPEDGETFNVSAYCVSMRAAEKFFAYKETLLKEREKILPPSADSTQTSVISEQGLQARLIDEELAHAKRAMDMTLQAYAEMMLAYPLHKQFQTAQKNLREYRDALHVLKNKIDEFPMRFIDATSSMCL